MASSGKKSGGDFVLESRHLVGLFLMLVVIFGIVFTLGYLLGRTQYDTRLRSALSKPAENVRPAAAPAAPEKKDKESDSADAQEPQPAKNDPSFDFYHDTDAKQPEERLRPATATPAIDEPRPAKAILPNPKSSAKLASTQKGTVLPKGSYMVQIAAVTTERDALSLAQALQQKKVTAVVVKPGADKYFRIQVGPFPDVKTATAAKRDLEAKGFKPILKH